MSDLAEMILDHAESPVGRGAMADPTVVGCANLGGQPPEVTIYLKVADHKVERARFQAQGCGYTIACCSVLMELIEGKPVSFCAELTPEDVLAVLKDVPAHRHFCASLATEALQRAIGALSNGMA